MAFSVYSKKHQKTILNVQIIQLKDFFIETKTFYDFAEFDCFLNIWNSEANNSYDLSSFETTFESKNTFKKVASIRKKTADTKFVYC